MRLYKMSKVKFLEEKLTQHVISIIKESIKYELYGCRKTKSTTLIPLAEVKIAEVNNSKCIKEKTTFLKN